MKNTFALIAVLLFSTSSFAAENSLVRKLLNHAQSGTQFSLKTEVANCESTLVIRERLVPETASQIEFEFGNVRLLADLYQQDAVISDSQTGSELTYKQSTGPKMIAFSHYLVNVRNQMVKYHPAANILTVEWIEYNYAAGTPVYSNCEYSLN